MWSILLSLVVTQNVLIGVSATSILSSSHSRSTVQATFNDLGESYIPTSLQRDIPGFIHRYNFSHPEAVALWKHDALVEGGNIWMETNEYAELFIPEHISKTLGKPYGAGYTTRPITIPAPPRSSWAEQSLSITIGLNSSYHDDYRDLSDLAAFTKSLVSDTPDLVTRRVYGHSFEGRPLEVLHLSQPNTTIKGSVVVLGPQHGREWVATASATYLLHALLTPKNETGSLAELLDHHDFYIIPTPNPDGYDYTWTSDRLWYKNRQSTGSRLCSGIDLARNWEFKWRKYATGPGFAESDDEGDEESDDLGADKESENTLVEPCSSGYPGVRPFEAPETSALDVFLRTLPSTTTGPAISAFIELRSYGQLISTPYGHSCKKTPRDAEDQLELAQGAGHVASRLYGTGFTVGRACATRFRAGGNALDYVYSRVGVKFAYTVHLRDTGTFGFALPKEMIRPVGEETAEMMAYLARFVRER